jgi:hypothetical protein
MKINEILREAQEFDDWEDDEPAPDADKDKVKHIVMQMRAALDVEGNYPISFNDGTKTKLPISDINLFLRKYETVKPADKEKMQQLASASKEGFDRVVKLFKGEARPKDAYSPDIRSRQGGFTQYT